METNLPGVPVPFDKPEPSSRTNAFLEGQLILDRFRIVRFIGRGGMGEVYEALDQELHEKIALKTTLPEIAQHPQILARFKQEIQFARRITHPNVCRIYDYFPQPGFLTMELLSGESLSQKLRRDGPLPPQIAQNIAIQICSGLHAAHQAGIVHRDFKTANVMLTAAPDGSPRAVVTDFGLAYTLVPSENTATVLTEAGAILGTPLYMAPEQLRAGGAGAASDIYALGLVLYELATGQLPSRGDLPTAPSRLAPGLDARWDLALSRCLQYDPAQRPTSAAEVASLLTGQSLPPTARAAVIPIRWRKPAAIAAGAAAIALSAGLAYNRFHSGYRPPSPQAQHWYDVGTAALREGTFLGASKALDRAAQIDPDFLLAHARLADAWSELDYSEKAKDEMIRASSLEALRGLPQIDRDYVAAVKSTLTNDPKAAVQKYESILEALPENEKAYGYVDLGRALEKARRPLDAIAAYQKAAAKAPEYPASFMRLGALYGRQAKTPEAEAAFSKAESLYRASSNIEGIAEVDFQRGLVASQQGRLDSARASTEKAMSAALSIPSTQLQVRALLQLSGIDHRKGDLQRAEEEASQAIQLAQDNGIVSWAVQGLVLLGNPYLIAGDYAKAESYFQKSLELAGRASNRRLQAFAQLSLASVRNKQNRPDECIAFAKSALDFYQPGGFVSNANAALTLLARAQVLKGNFTEARKAFESQSALGKKVNDPAITARAEEGLGGILMRQEKYPEALAHYRAALESGKELGLSFVPMASIHLASALGALGRYSEANDLLQQAAPAAKTQLGLAAEIARVSASLLVTQNQNARALQVCRNAHPAQEDLGVTVMEAQSLCRAGDPRSAIALCRRILEQTTPDTEYTMAAHLILLEALPKAGDLSEAQQIAASLKETFGKRGQRDSEWRTWLLDARLRKGSGDAAAAADSAGKALDILESFPHNWEFQDSQSYLKRPDVLTFKQELETLSRPTGRTRRTQ